MYHTVRERSRRIRRTRASWAIGAFLLLLTPIVGFSTLQGGGTARADTAVAQTYYTPFEAQQFIDILRGLAGNPGCCSSPVTSTVSIVSGADGNVVYYDHFEDGYEVDPVNPVQASTLTLNLDAGAVWTQTSSVPVDVGGARGAGNFYDGRDRISSTQPIAVTQGGYASGAGTLLASDAAVLDYDKSGLRYDVPAGQNADYNQVFEYTGLVIVATGDATTVDLDLDANGSFESNLTLDEGEIHVVNGGVMLGAVVAADKRVSVYVTTGDIGATYESRFFELYPTAIWADTYVSPVGAYDGVLGTRVFLFNPGTGPITIDVLTGTGATSTVALAAGGQGSYLMPVDAGAQFSSQGGEPFYAFQMLTTEGSSTSAYDWGFTLVPGQAVTPSVIIPYGPGSEGLTNNYSPVWVAATADTTLYVDRDGDPATGALIDPQGNGYDFSCVVGAFDSITLYDDGTTNCYLPSQSSAGGGDRDMTGAKIYSLSGARIAAAWGQRPGYTGGLPALDMGTAILPFPELLITKSSVLSVDLDSDGLADAGDVIAYTIIMDNLGIIDVSGVTLTDETPANTAYVSGSVTFDTVPQADDGLPFSASPLDTDSPTGSFPVGTIGAGTSRTIEARYTVGSIPFGVSEIANIATMVTQYGPASALNRRSVDVPPLQIHKTSAPSASPVGSGDTITYTIQVASTDAITQTGVDVTDSLSAGTTYVPGSVTADIEGTPVAAGPPPALVTGATLGLDEVLTITFDVTVDAPIAAGTTEFTNTATAVSIQHPTPVSDDATDPAGPNADLSLIKVDDETGPLSPGELLTYSITVTNSGPDEAADVVVTDTLPVGVTFVAASSDPSCVEGPTRTITCSLGDLGSTAVSLDIAVTIDPTTSDGMLTNTATVTSPTPDDDPSDDTDTEDTLIDVPPTLVVTKTPTPGAVDEPGNWVTFAIEVENTSAETVTLTALTDDVFGDLRNPSNPDVVANTCAAASPSIAAGASLLCSFDGFVAGSFGDPNHLDTATATVVDDEANPASADASAAVSFADAVPTVTVAKAASVTSVTEPGSMVTFTLTLSNTSVESVTVTALTDDVFGDLLDVANPDVGANTCTSLPATFGVGAVFGCSFAAFVAGNGTDPDHIDTVTFAVEDDDGNPASDQASASVGFDNAAPTATVTKSGDSGTVTEPGGTITFTVTIDNTGPEALFIDALTDSVFGDLRNPGNAAVFNNTCPALGTQVPAGGWVTCWFDADLVGLFGDPDHVDVVTATLSDDEGTSITPSDDALVAFAPANSTIGGLVFADLDRDGIKDVGESGLGGVDVEVTSFGGAFTIVTTAANGTWSTAVLPGAATVEVDPTNVPVGYSLTTANQTQTVMALMGQHVPAEDVGYGPPLGALQGMLFLDLDGDPNRDPYEPPLAGLGVQILRAGTVISSTTSSSTGTYSFSGLPAGTYTVRVVQATIPAGYASSVDYDGGTDGSAVATVASGATTSGVDFGHHGTGTVGDTVWLDEDEDGSVGEFEEPIEDADVTLTWWGFDGVAGNGDDYTFPSQTTDENGYYRYRNLPPGRYALTVDTSGIAAGLDPTTPTTVALVLSAGGTNMTADFGFVVVGALPYTGLAAEHLLLASALMIGLGALVFADTRKRERKYRVALERME